MSELEKVFLLDIHDRIHQIAGNDVDLTRKLQLLAFGILVNIDGESSYLPAFKLIPIEDSKKNGRKDIAGNLHNNFYKIIEK